MIQLTISFDSIQELADFMNAKKTDPIHKADKKTVKKVVEKKKEEIVPEKDFSRYRVCANPDCRKPFLHRRKDQVYCSTKCYQTLFQKTYQKRYWKTYKRKDRMPPDISGQIDGSEKHTCLNPNCQKEFNPKESSFKEYCSISCYQHVWYMEKRKFNNGDDDAFHKKLAELKKNNPIIKRPEFQRDFAN